MHLPAQYEGMPRGAEREDGLSGESHMERGETHGTGGGGKKKNNTKPLCHNIRGGECGTGEREEGQNKMDGVDDAETERAKRKGAAEEERGVSKLTGSPSVLGLPPPSVYRCPAETEGTTGLHTPPSPGLPTLTPAACDGTPHQDEVMITITNINTNSWLWPYPSR